MRFRVEIAAAALRDAEQYHSFIRQQSHDHVAATLWWNGLLDAIDSLETLPARCPLIPEQQHFLMPLHQLIYASHRIIFRIDGQAVRIARIYHASLRPLKVLQQGPQPRKPA